MFLLGLVKKKKQKVQINTSPPLLCCENDHKIIKKKQDKYGIGLIFDDKNFLSARGILINLHPSPQNFDYFFFQLTKPVVKYNKREGQIFITKSHQILLFPTSFVYTFCVDCGKQVLIKNHYQNSKFMRKFMY